MPGAEHAVADHEGDPGSGPRHGPRAAVVIVLQVHRRPGHTAAVPTRGHSETGDMEIGDRRGKNNVLMFALCRK